MKELITLIYVLIFGIIALIAYAVMQIKLIGLNVKDFWSFIEANEMLINYIKLQRNMN